MTGVATCRFEGGQFTFFQSYEFPAYDATRLVHKFMEEYPSNTHVGVERYDDGITGSRHVSPQPEAMYTIGALRYAASLCRITVLLQGRAEAKKVTDDMLRVWGWWNTTRDGHANAAARQVGLVLLKRFPVEYMSLLDRVE